MSQEKEKKVLASIPDEEVVLGSIIDHPQIFDTYKILEEDFYSVENKQIYQAIVKTLKASDSISTATLVSLGCPEGAISRLVFLGVDARSVSIHIEKIKAFALARRATEAIKSSYSKLGNTDTVMEGIEEIASALLSSIKNPQEKVFTGEDLSDIADNNFAPWNPPEKNRAIPASLPALVEAFCGGWEPGGLYVIAARPGKGKSVLGFQEALNIASLGLPVLAMSTEMTAKQLVPRMVAHLGDINGRAILQGTVSPDEHDKFRDSSLALRKLPIRLIVKSSMTTLDIERAVRREGRKFEAKGKKLELLVVDYFQRMRSVGRHGNRTEELGGMVREIKDIALSHDIPVLLLVQVGRGVESEARPIRSSDMRECGDIEAEADGIIGINCSVENEKEKYWLAIIKGRSTGSGYKINVEFQKHYSRFRQVGESGDDDCDEAINRMYANGAKGSN